MFDMCCRNGHVYVGCDHDCMAPDHELIIRTGHKLVYGVCHAKGDIQLVWQSRT